MWYVYSHFISVFLISFDVIHPDVAILHFPHKMYAFCYYCTRSTAHVVALMEETMTASESDEEMSDDDPFLPITGSLAPIAEMSM